MRAVMKQPGAGAEPVTSPTYPFFCRTVQPFSVPSYGFISSLVSTNLPK